MSVGCLTDPLQEMTYIGVVFHYTVRIILMIDVFNDINITLFGIYNAYLNIETYEKVYFVSGNYFIPKVEGGITVLVKALYGLKLSSESFQITW